MAVLDVEGLRTYYKTLRGDVKAVDGVSFRVEKGEATGIAGESGCGKTTLALSILRLLPSGGKIVEGKVVFDGTSLGDLTNEQLRKKVRWKGISLVFQGAMNAFNPVYKVGEQIVEAIRIHEPDVSKKDAWQRAGDLFELVGIERGRADNYPHEFSGGMKQRALIAMALALNPKMLIADEPGTALDVIVQAQVLKLMRELKEKLGLSMILISHDLSILAETCDKMAIMYAGKVVEYGSVYEVFKEPLHPYTQGLVGAFPRLKGPRTKLSSVPGSPPDLLNPPAGCHFHPRCPFAMDVCKKEEPPLIQVGSKDHYVACWLYPGK
ncbi:ABC transporter ATP-binding protein [Candidatus Bathyarchaeota archaeon]|jgi:peptide/nickel transport system ATP-binding protein|nr:MAG: ABC transporter ATP-binding protein [Candidatus Bathyarchaeota archaeon]